MNTDDRDDRLDHEGLSDAERAAIEEQDDQGRDTKPPAANADDPPAAPPAAQAGDDDDQEDDDRADLRDAAAAMREAAAAMRAKEQTAEQPPAEAPPAARDFDGELKALKAKYDEGELDSDDYQEQRDAIRDARLIEQVRQERALESHQQQQQAFARAYGEFFTGSEAEMNQRLGTAALKPGFDNLAVQLVAQGMGHGDALKEARRQIFEQIGVEMPAAKDEKAAKEDAVAKRAAKDRPAPGLGDVPAAGALATDVDTELDSLGIEELEMRIARMSPEKREAYLAGSDGGLRDNPRARD